MAPLRLSILLLAPSQTVVLTLCHPVPSLKEILFGILVLKRSRANRKLILSALVLLALLPLQTLEVVVSCLSQQICIGGFLSNKVPALILYRRDYGPTTRSRGLLQHTIPQHIWLVPIIRCHWETRSTTAWCLRYFQGSITCICLPAGISLTTCCSTMLAPGPKSPHDCTVVRGHHNVSQPKSRDSRSLIISLSVFGRMSHQEEITPHGAFEPYATNR